MRHLAFVVAIVVLIISGVNVLGPRMSSELPEANLPPQGYATSGNEMIADFNSAKKIARGIYRGMEYTFYCGCRYYDRAVDHGSCGYESPSDSERAHRVEWEHVVPAYDFGRSFAAWREGDRRCVTERGRAYKGRSCARLVSEEFRRMEADLYNLVPEIGELNQQRSNYPMGLLPNTQVMFGRCETKIANHTIEPRPEIRGFVARTYKYMDATYPGHGIISRKNRRLFDAWDRQYPPTAQEIERARRIARQQGNRNEFVLGRGTASAHRDQVNF